MRVVVVNVNALSGRKCAGEGGMEEGKRRACRQKGASGEFFKWHAFSSIKPATSWRVLG